MNPLLPSLLNTQERLAEVCRILASGAIRLRATKSTLLSGTDAESSLHLSADQSGHATPTQRRNA